jgi:hypothetical protein
MYGSVDSATGRSFTEREFDYAVSRKKPVLAFYHKNLGSLRTDKTESTDSRRESLRKFTAKVKRQRMCESWETGAELGSAVKSAIIAQLKDDPRPGWVRASATPQKRNVAQPPRGDEIDILFEDGKQTITLTIDIYTEPRSGFHPEPGDTGIPMRELLFTHQLSISSNELLLALSGYLGVGTSSHFLADVKSTEIAMAWVAPEVETQAPEWANAFDCALKGDELAQAFHVWHEKGLIRVISLENDGAVEAKLDRKGLKLISKLQVSAIKH